MVFPNWDNYVVIDVIECLKQITLSRNLLNTVLGDPEVTANIYCKSRNLPNTDMQNYSTDLR